jgi:uncharacterized protein with von Willebrand factor type A (vWA) domain
VVLCDISGSMEPYARALLMLLYVLNGGGLARSVQPGGNQTRPEVFSFATRLTRLTPALSAATPDTMLAKAGEAAPDWSGGTRIGAAVKEFNDHYGSRGMTRPCSAPRWRACIGSPTGSSGPTPAPSPRATAPRSAAWPPPGPTATP